MMNPQITEVDEEWEFQKLKAEIFTVVNKLYGVHDLEE